MTHLMEPRTLNEKGGSYEYTMTPGTVTYAYLAPHPIFMQLCRRPNRLSGSIHASR